MTIIDEAPGDMLGLRFPAHREALLAAGPEFLTAAFRATGALAADNSVTRIDRFEECPGGSTGQKFFLTVGYQRSVPGRHEQLFVKFSRDFQDHRRDRAKVQMERETRFALLSRSPDFPVTVPRCYFADYHRESGTGILITHRVPFGEGGIEPHHEKCLDHRIPDALDHYCALVRAIARLAGTHRAGRLPPAAEQFAFDPAKLAVSARAPATAEHLQRRVADVADFATRFPHLLPPDVTTPDFLSRLGDDALLVARHEPALQQLLRDTPEFIAINHWNANIDNAWFWRDDTGRLECGLLDWGNVGEMNVAAALWGVLSGAGTQTWAHLDRLLDLFAAEFAGSGGPALDQDTLRVHLLVYVALMGITWLFDAPALLRARVPQLPEFRGRFDPRLERDEFARTQLHMLATVLTVWEAHDIGKVVRTAVQPLSGAPTTTAARP